MKIVGLVSCYKEGRLVQGAIRSLHAVGLDDMLIYEGPAGDPLSAETPDSDFAGWDSHPLSWDVFRGRWRSDARKRNAMLEEAKRRHPEGPVWGVWLDGDEVLRDAEYLRDELQAVIWSDEIEPDEPPTIAHPLWIVEADGSVALTKSRLVRLDLIRSYDISVSVVTNKLGLEEALGNENPDARIWLDVQKHAMATGRLLSLPPHPGQPHIVHRSNLRHPLRRGLRMHKQEADELKKAGKL